MTTAQYETHPMANEVMTSSDRHVRPDGVEETVVVRQGRASRRILALFLTPLLFVVFAVFPVEIAAMIAAGGAFALAGFLAPIWLAREVKVQQDRKIESGGANS